MRLRSASALLLLPALLATGGPAEAAAGTDNQVRASELFQPVEAIPTGSTTPESVTIGDVTGDGRADVVLTSSSHFDPENDYKLFVFAQQADGSLAAAIRYPTRLVYQDGGGAGVALLDRDGDGRLDVALATLAGVEIFQQTAAGTLESRGIVPGSRAARAVVAADVDADGDADLVTGGHLGIEQLVRGADGTLTPSVVTTDPSIQVEVGDVNGDGRADVVGQGLRQVNAYRRTAAGGWSRGQVVADDGATVIGGIEVADVSGDGRSDVVVTLGWNQPRSQLQVFTQTAGGGLASPVVQRAYDNPETVEAADVDGDGRNDVVLPHGGYYALSTWPQQPDGTLGTPVYEYLPYASHYPAQGLALGDVDGDGRVDAVLTDYNHGLLVLRNAG
ncbi:FG-GAP repeat domain-containing protein [Plantactinospora endophytica]|uniref:VCBS repeat-containing protein n=1 Tax=Plantactinospora endophytica TaxID=673535 RepID=A0ABQ4ECV6_9ACTN|nr:VCBS repeat-containing protein [Plantactinospora endophytica]GIG92544.1 hypothetical protein Pen02_74800 [Plantactinospora endophytica]